YARLFTPLHAFVRNSNLVIVPHSVLHYAPFSAFYDAQTQQYLAESYAVTYAPSATLYKQLLDKRNPNDGRVLVLGDSDEQLPFARQEARAVGEFFDTVPRLGVEATESELYAQAKQLDILHLAAAGLYEPSEPLFSKLLLEADDANDGQLEAYEIFSKLDLSNANLVVLSGNSQPEGTAPGDGAALQALTWAFQYAGSPAVLTSNWRVDDESVATFFEAFYRHLREQNTTAEALRLAQMEILADPDTASPYYWAAFNLIGDYQGNGEFHSPESDAADAESSGDVNVSASQATTETGVVTSGVGGITQSNELTNVFVVTEGAEIAGQSSANALEDAESAAGAETTESAAANGNNAVTMPLGELTNGVCNNVTLPLGLVLVADFFR
ncbi:MAG: CHAT domain-containing protein, partial [Caldilineaceae bacterium]|nr:CHAT domain-containing protein [Caldilineaceae bacterium]